MCEWRSGSNSGYRCNLPSLPGGRYCVLHEDRPKDVQPFLAACREQILGDGGERSNERFDFRGYVFPRGVSLAGGTRPISAKAISPAAATSQHTIWLPSDANGHLCLDEADVGNVVLCDISIRSVSCVECKVHGFLMLSRVQATGDVTLAWAEVTKYAGVYFCEIDGRLTVAKSEIAGDLHVTGGRASGGLHVTSSSIDGSFLVVACGLGGVADLRRTQVAGDLSIVGADLGSLAYFDGLSVVGEIELRQVTFDQRADFSLALCGGLDIGRGEPSIGRRRASSQGVTLNSLEAAVEFWNFAARTYEQARLWPRADAARFHERVCRLRMDACRSGWKGWRGRLAYAADAVFLRWPTAYGASLTRLSLTWLSLVGGFGLLYFAMTRACPNLLFNMSSDGLAWPLSLGRALYFSITTFTTLGYGDFQPAPGLGSILVSVEAILGGITMALTVLVIGRKFMR